LVFPEITDLETNALSIPIALGKQLRLIVCRQVDPTNPGLSELVENQFQ